MPPVPLTQGSYTARSIIANAQRCLNLYPEKNTEDAEAPFSFYPTPGLRILSAAGAGGTGWRGLFTASNGSVYGVQGNRVYYISPSWQLTQLGTIAPGANPVSMVDNGITLILVDGTATGGYQITLTTNAFSQILDPNFSGYADKVAYLDTFVLNNKSGTPDFFSSLSNTLSWDPTYFAAKTGYSDLLQTLMVMHREIWLFGVMTTEVWYNAGNPNFPFAIIPGTFIQQGCIAKYSVAQHDLLAFWLSQTQDGKGVVLMGANYMAKRISTHAIEYAINKYSTIADAIGFTYQQEGHVFYVLNFPSGKATWVYDVNTQLWHERNFIDGNGVEDRWRIQCVTNAYGTLIGGDWQNNRLYQLDLDYYQDGDGMPVVRRKGFPHMLKDGDKVQYMSFTADMECGSSDSSTDDPQVFLRWSDDRGKTWGNPVAQSLGLQGEYLTQPSWSRLGLARDRVFELYWSAAVKTALNGAWVLTKPTRA